MTEQEKLLTSTDAARIMGIPRSTFYIHERRGLFAALRAARPVGNRKYVRARVEEFARGESVEQAVAS